MRADGQDAQTALQYSGGRRLDELEGMDAADRFAASEFHHHHQWNSVLRVDFQRYPAPRSAVPAVQFEPREREA